MVKNKTDLEMRAEIESTRLFEIMSCQADLMWTFNNDKILQTANNAYLEILSNKANFNSALPFFPNNVSDIHDLWELNYQRVLNKETFTVDEIVLNPRTKTSEHRLFLFQPLFDAMFDQIGGTCISKVITAKLLDETGSNSLIEKEKAVLKLKESESRLHTAMKIGRLGYWQLKADGSDRYWSDEVYEIFGLRRDTFVITFESFLNIIHPDDRDAYEIAQQAYYQLNNTFEFEYRIVLPDGTERWISEKGEVLRKEDGSANIYQGMVQDITTRKLMSSSLEESNKRYELVTQASFDAIWDWDIIKGLLYFGQGFQYIFGYDLEANKPDVNKWNEYVHKDDLNRIINSVDTFLKSSAITWQEEYRYLKADGTYACVVDKGIVIRDDNQKPLRMVGAMQDITQRKKDEDELKSFAGDLFKRNKELQEFGYIVSHNLRSPVANIIGITNLIESEKNDPDVVTHCVNVLKISVNRLDNVIKDLSQILSISDGSADWKKEPVNLIEIIENVKTDLSKMRENASAEIETTAGVFMINSHKAYLYSIFLNLISNSIKYKADRNPKIVISITQSAEYTVLTVSDNGIGIDLSKHENDVFKPYKRFNRDIDGKGLGLFLVKSHVEALRGVISIQSTPGQGTTFTIKFPTT